ncbi:hypothetical protein [Streptomyces variegatus]|uniref:hypothetical protein n=1 Tax=Streptomyces variegatus TaxID=284040 RepID=UPI003C2CD27C
MSAYTLTRLRQPSPRDLLNIDLGHLTDDLMFRMAGTLEQSFKSVLRRNKAGGVDRIAVPPTSPPRSAKPSCSRPVTTSKAERSGNATGRADG